MIPVECPTCNLRWNVRDDTPSTFMCPRCLSNVHRPEAQTEAQPAEPIGIRPITLEYEARLDQRVGMGGLIFTALILVIGLCCMVPFAVSRFEHRPLIGKFILVGSCGLVLGALIATVLSRYSSAKSAAGFWTNDRRDNPWPASPYPCRIYRKGWIGNGFYPASCRNDVHWRSQGARPRYWSPPCGSSSVPHCPRLVLEYHLKQRACACPIVPTSSSS